MAKQYQCWKAGQLVVVPPLLPRKRNSISLRPDARQPNLPFRTWSEGGRIGKGLKPRRVQTRINGIGVGIPPKWQPPAQGDWDLANSNCRKLDLKMDEAIEFAAARAL